MKSNSNFIWIITLLLAITLVSAADFTPQGNINLRNIYNIKNVKSANFSSINNILYVQQGNGSDIQAKINLANQGDLIYLPTNSTYFINSTILLNKKGITIAGVNRGGNRANDDNGIILEADTGLNGLNMINVTSAGITLKDLSIDGNAITKDGVAIYNSTAGSFYGENLKLINHTRNGLFMGSEIDYGSRLDRINSRLNGLHGMEIQRADVIITNYFADRNWNGAALFLNPGGSAQITNMHSFYNNYGIYLNGSRAITITGNVLEQNNYSAIYIDSSSAFISRVSIMGNTFYSNDCPLENCIAGDGDGTPVIYFKANINPINKITIIGNNMDSRAQIFDYSETSSPLITEIISLNNAYNQSYLGNYPTGVDTGIFSNYLSTQNMTLYLTGNGDNIDRSGVNNNISINSSGTSYSTDARLGYSFSFNKTNLGGIKFTPTSMVSTCFWAKPSSLNDQKDVFINGTQVVGARTLNLWGIFNGTSWNTATATVDKDIWQHICYSFNGTNYLLYKNSLYSGYLNTSLITNINAIANTPNTINNFNGTIDDIKIWSRGINSSEIKADYIKLTELNFINPVGLNQACANATYVYGIAVSCNS